MNTVCKRLLSVSATCLLMLSSAFPCLADGEAQKAFIAKSYAKALSLSGRKSFNGYCGSCVAYQLWALGINNGYVGQNGNTTYSCYCNQAQTSGGWYTIAYPSSEYTLKQTLEFLNAGSFDTVYFPTLLGFKKGTASPDGQVYGHTLLIYGVYDGMVYFTESMYPTAEENALTLSIDDFCSRYRDDPLTVQQEFSADGAILFYSSAPQSAVIRTSKSSTPVWSPITLTVAAPGANEFMIGIDRDGKRITTINTKGQNQYTVNIGEPGYYTAYVTCQNRFGYCDSAPIGFEVFDTAPAGQWISSDKQSISCKEAVTLRYGSYRATSYNIGVIAPTGEAENIAADPSGTMQKSFEAPGIYRVFVTCCNAFGYVDSEEILIEVLE